MSRATTHFAPTWERLPRKAGISAPPMISVTAMAGVSAFVRDAFGDKVLRQANQAAMLDIELIEDRECFIPQATMAAFLSEVDRRGGEKHLGLLLAPHLSFARYGCWGEYLLASDTLGAALKRAVSTLGFHSTGDRLNIALDNNRVRVSYVNAMRGRAGYTHIASATAGVILSLLHAFVPADWRPYRIELDIPRPSAANTFEDCFDCPVVFDAAAVTVSFDAHLLDRPALSRLRSRLLTLDDVARATLEPSGLDTFLGAVIAQIRAQVMSGAASIDSTAQALDFSVRSLQRTLHHQGADFRALVGAVRAQCAKELLGGSEASITEIASAIGYSSPANFARAFRKETGLAPQAFRAARGIAHNSGAKSLLSG